MSDANVCIILYANDIVLIAKNKQNVQETG